MLTHIVLISTSDDATDAQIEATLAGLRSLPEQIEAIASYDVGRDLGLAEGNATIAIQATFASPSDLDAYIAHRKAREAQVEKAVKEGLSRIKDMVPVLYADVDPRLHPAAARSVYSPSRPMCVECRTATAAIPLRGARATAHSIACIVEK